MARHGSLFLWMGPFLCLGSFPALVPASLCGQEVQVRVLASETLEPIPTAFVSLLDEDGDPVRRALTNPQGRALFSLPRSGSYMLTAEMFGRAFQDQAVRGDAARRELCG